MKRGYVIGGLIVAAMLCGGCMESKAGLEFSVNPLTKTMTLKDRTDRALMIEDFDAGWGEGKYAKFKKLDARQDTTSVVGADMAGYVAQIKAHGENLVAIGAQLNQMLGTVLPVLNQLATNARPTNLGGVMTDPAFQQTVRQIIYDMQRQGQIQGVPQAAQPSK